jgi:ketosteroid isomerase-like protein
MDHLRVRQTNMSINREFAASFAKKWVDAANARDLDRGLALYAEEVEAASPFIRVVMNEPSGKLTGKSKLREYWTATQTKRAELWFELIDVFVGADSIVIHYVNRGQRCAEVFYFDERGLVSKSIAHYLES